MAIGFPDVPPEDRILAELPRLAEALRLLEERERVREHNHPEERNPLLAAELAMIKAEFGRLNEEHRRRPLAERVPESVYLTDDEGNYAGAYLTDDEGNSAGLEWSTPQR